MDATSTGLLRGVCDVDLPVRAVFSDVSRVHTEELGDWREDGEAVDSDGLIRRRDYSVDISADSPAAHYSRNHRVVDGIVLPMNRIVYARDDDGQPLRDMVTVTIDIDDVTVT